MNNPPVQSSRPVPFRECLNIASRKTHWVAFAIFAALVFIAYFQRFDEFGFYSDDAALVGGVVNRSWPEEVDHLRFSLVHWPQGRPLGMGLNLSLIPYVVAKLGRLPGLHLVAWLILSANMFLVWRIIGRTAPPLVAFAAAGFYGLCPAHTVQAQLVWAYNSQVALLCALGAILAGLSQRWIWYALGVAATTLMAEPAAMVALAWPALVVLRPNWPALRRSITAIAIWAAVVAVILAARKYIGDPAGQERVGEITAHPWETLRHSLESATTGPLVHLQLASERLFAPFREFDTGVALTMMLAALLGLGGALLLHRSSNIPHSITPSDDGSPQKSSKSPALQELTGGVELVIIGFLVMVAVYASFFRDPWHPANWKAGFMSGVHLAAVCGSSLLFGGLIWMIGAISAQYRAVFQALALSTVFALFSGFGVLVQREYVASWAFQRSFWRSYSELCRDAGDRTYVLVLDRDLPAFRFVDRSSWTTEVLPSGLFKYNEVPEKVTSIPWRPPRQPAWVPPSVIFVGPEPSNTIRREGEKYSWKPSYYFMLPKSADQQPETGNVIFLDHTGGSWHRLTGDVQLEGGSLELKKQEPEAPGHPLKPLAALYGL